MVEWGCLNNVGENEDSISVQIYVNVILILTRVYLIFKILFFSSKYSFLTLSYKIKKLQKIE